MKSLFRGFKFISIIAIASLLVSSVIAFFMSAMKTVQAGLAFASGLESGSLMTVRFIQIIDMSLIATALYVFAVGLYELFIGKLDIPEWMSSTDLYQLEIKLGSLLILIMAGTFLEHLMKWRGAQDTMFFAISIAVVSMTLIGFSLASRKSG